MGHWLLPATPRQDSLPGHVVIVDGFIKDAEPRVANAGELVELLFDQ